MRVWHLIEVTEMQGLAESGGLAELVLPGCALAAGNFVVALAAHTGDTADGQSASALELEHALSEHGMLHLCILCCGHLLAPVLLPQQAAVCAVGHPPAWMHSS